MEAENNQQIHQIADPGRSAEPNGQGQAAGWLQRPEAPDTQEWLPLPDGDLTARSERTWRRPRRMLKDVQEESRKTQQAAAQEYERDLTAIYEPRNRLETALVEHLARALARYDAMERLEAELQRRFFELSLAHPHKVVFDAYPWEQYARHAPRLGKSLQSEVLKLIHEIERLQLAPPSEKAQPVRVIDHNTG